MSNYYFLIYSYYKCAKSNNVICTGTAKRNVDGTITEVKPHNHVNHARSNNREIIKIFRDSLKTRAKNENISLKSIYDEESQR